MSLITTKEILKEARKNGYAVPAFNAENMEMVQAIIEGGVLADSPVILQTTPSTLKYMDAKTFYSIAKSISDKVNIPIAIHLDHGNTFELCQYCIESGYTSIMIDGSKFSFEENVNLSKKVVDIAKAKNIPVEAELGAVGGKEDAHIVLDKDAIYTNPNEAVEFVERTGIQSLAVAIGTTHGHYKEAPKLDFDRLKSIAELVSIPLVLHGTSGVLDEDVKRCVQIGISKVNYATELRDTYTKAVRSVLEDKTVFDPKAYGKAAKQSITELVIYRMKVCGSFQKA
ncbi:MAG: class II fructose-bisphosphate aldolase [Elusimicrobiota bacterium]|jgi:tagatose 1,6-diphosphate aldolase GatY/KbaY|nr:class II fructose-bisphosphate aldolase [Elusimicrobiota bacterium]